MLHFYNLLIKINKMGFQKRKEVKETSEVRLILVDLAVEIPVTLSYEGSKYELKPDGVVPKGLADKFKDFAQYEVYDAQNKEHVRLVENKDTLFTTRKNYGTFDMMREWELLSPSQKDETIAFIRELKNPKLPEVVTAEEVKIQS